MKKIISYSLWGNNKKYTIGAIKNAKNNLEIYPDFISRFYVDLTVPKDIIFQLEEMEKVEVIQKNVIGDWRFSAQRFLPFAEQDVECFLSRDCDSRSSLREEKAVREWEKSGKIFHIMRDHPYHAGFPILAGMFGSKGGIIKEINKMIEDNILVNTYHSDQIFLEKYIHPLIKENCVVHDEFFDKLPFPKKREGLEFIGEPFNEDDTPCNMKHREELQKYEIL